MSQSNAVTTIDRPPARTPMSIASGLKSQFAETLPKHIDPDAFARTVQTALQVQPELMECTPRSLMIACMKAATDGLILDGREAALIVRRAKTASKGKGGAVKDAWELQATYQPMVQGLMKLARNSGEIVSIVAHVVYSNDVFRYILGDEEHIEHAPAPFTQEQGDPVAVYAIVKLRDGTAVREVMRASAVMNIAGQGKNAWQYQPPKTGKNERGEMETTGGRNFAEWWRKTVIRRITKYIPRSSDAVGAFSRAVERIDEDFDFDGEEAAPPPAPVTRKARGGGAAALRDITPPREPDDPQTLPEGDENGDVPDYGPDDYDRETGEIIDHGTSQQPGDDI